MKTPPETNWVWWKHGMVYHIYPMSYQDSNGDGIGDLQGIISRLPYLEDLGVDAIWLSPIFRSPMADYGYDVSDYRSIDPVFGTMGDFRELIEKAHARGIRIILDMVFNHTSDEHPWFIESRKSLVNPKRNWYIWRQGRNGRPPNNWKSAIGGSAWKYDPQTGQYYLHSFFPQQPDLNWRDPELADSLLGELRYWLDAGVDGFRFDVINLVVKDKKFRDNPGIPGVPVFQRHLYTRNRKRSLAIVGDIRTLLEEYGSDKVSIGEIYTPPPGDPGTVAKYLGDGTDGIHLAFDFSLMFAPWNAHAYFQRIRDWYERIPAGGWPCQVLSNHDLLRHIDRVPWRTRREEKARLSAVLLMTLEGTPFIYYGEEIGMHNTPVPRSSLRDPLGKRFWPWFDGRDKARTPMQWNATPGAGFSTARPWLPLNRDAKTRNIQCQEADPGSLLSLYRNLIMTRRSHPSLYSGKWIPVTNGKNGILAYYRRSPGERTLVVLNFTGKVKTVSLQEHLYGRVILSTHRCSDEYNYFQKMEISPYEASVWLVME